MGSESQLVSYCLLFFLCFCLWVSVGNAGSGDDRVEGEAESKRGGGETGGGAIGVERVER